MAARPVGIETGQRVATPPAATVTRGACVPAVALGLFLVFIGVPILEIALFIKVGGLIGGLPTLALCFLTALAGFACGSARFAVSGSDAL